MPLFVDNGEFIVNKFVISKLDKVYKENIAKINKTITKELTEHEKKAQSLIQETYDFVFGFIGTNLSSILSGLTLITRATTELYNIPVDLAFRKYYGVEKLGISNYIDLFHRRRITESELLTISRFLGFDTKTIDYANKLFLKFGDLSGYISLFRRGFITSGVLDDYSNALGYDNKELSNFKLLTEYYPSTSDLVSFAVREAFEPDERLWIHEGNAIPKPFSDYGVKIGLNDEWIKRFWHSHWRLLGSGQILEAFHRGFINREVLLDYLKRLDYTEKDRELILSMSYNLLTRVDVRRMFMDGIISSKNLFEYYQTLGFSEKDSYDMLKLSKSMRFIDTTDLRKLYLKEYEIGLLTTSEIKTKLRDTGLDSDEISNFLYISERQTELERVIIIKEQIELQFYNGFITFEVLIQQLRGLGVSDKELKRIEKFSSVFQYQEKTLPTKTELIRFLKNGIIDLETWISYMRKRGYSTDVMYMYLQEIKD